MRYKHIAFLIAVSLGVGFAPPNASAYTVTTFSPTGFPYTESQLGIDGMVIENFEDAVLAPGLSVWFGPYTTEGTRQFSSGNISNDTNLAWDGSHVLAHEVDQYSVFFKFDKSTRSFGIALSAAPGWIDIAVNNNYSHYVHDNIANLSGFVSGNNRNLYYRIDAESGDPDIKFIRFDTGGSSFGSPSTYFDLLAFGVSGCTDPNATNYNPDATADDGSCESEQKTGDCQHASYNPKDRTLSLPVIELPVIDLLNKQATGDVELWTAVLKQKYKEPAHFRLLGKTVSPIIEGSTSTCPAAYSLETGMLSIPYIDVPTAVALAGSQFESELLVFKATLKWEPQERVFVIKEVEQRP